MPFVKELKKEGRNVYVLADNAPAHHSNINTHFFKVSDVVKLLWPPNSPDANAIEQAWLWLWQLITQDFPPSTTAKECEKQCKQEWENFPIVHINGWIDGIPKWIIKILKQEGDNIFHGWKKNRIFIEKFAGYSLSTRAILAPLYCRTLVSVICHSAWADSLNHVIPLSYFIFFTICYLLLFTVLQIWVLLYLPNVPHVTTLFGLSSPCTHVMVKAPHPSLLLPGSSEADLSLIISLFCHLRCSCMLGQYPPVLFKIIGKRKEIDKRIYKLASWASLASPFPWKWKEGALLQAAIQAVGPTLFISTKLGCPR